MSDLSNNSEAYAMCPGPHRDCLADVIAPPHVSGPSTVRTISMMHGDPGRSYLLPSSALTYTQQAIRNVLIHGGASIGGLCDHDQIRRNLGQPGAS